MNVFVAGASGAIGRPLITELIQQGYSVTGLTRSESGAKRLQELGASVAVADIFDIDAVKAAIKASKAEVVIDELTSLPKSPAEMSQSVQKDREVRIDGGRNLIEAAEACGVRRYIQQSSGFFLHPGDGLADESVGMVVDASPRVSFSASSYEELESRLAKRTSLEPVALRYGFFYGPLTWYHPDGACADQARRQELAIIGQGQAVWSWVHIEDAAHATVSALSAPAGVYNIVDDDPSPVSVWLPAFAKFVAAPQPPTISVDEARKTGGEDAIYYGTKLRGASNQKAKTTFGFQPRRLEWLER